MFAVPASVGTTHAAPELRQRRMWIETDFRDTVVGDTVAHTALHSWVTRVHNLVRNIVTTLVVSRQEVRTVPLQQRTNFSNLAQQPRSPHSSRALRIVEDRTVVPMQKELERRHDQPTPGPMWQMHS